MIKSILFTLLVIGINCHSGSAQKVDYLSIRDNTCGINDSLSLVQSRIKMEAFDTNLIKSNLDSYYYDLGMIYYKVYCWDSNPLYINKAIYSNEMALFHNPKSNLAYWQLGFINYFFLKDCEKGKSYIEKYKQYTKRKHWDNDQIKELTKFCSNSDKM
ncbi:MAG: hypothetical protein ABI851_07825 [Saprospiraceae bacterium]